MIKGIYPLSFTLFTVLSAISLRKSIFLITLPIGRKQIYIQCMVTKLPIGGSPFWCSWKRKAITHVISVSKWNNTGSIYTCSKGTRLKAHLCQEKILYELVQYRWRLVNYSNRNYTLLTLLKEAFLHVTYVAFIHVYAFTWSVRMKLGLRPYFTGVLLANTLLSLPWFFTQLV